MAHNNETPPEVPSAMDYPQWDVEQTQELIEDLSAEIAALPGGPTDHLFLDTLELETVDEDTHLFRQYLRQSTGFAHKLYDTFND
jgi:hypothetical protein